MNVIKFSVPEAHMRSYRAARVASRLDASKRAELTREIAFESPPTVEERWRVGLVVGPSGTGKSTAARSLFGDVVDWRPTWRDDRPVIDEFADRPFETLESALAAVGFGAPTRQLQRYSTLSVGERFRVELARTLLEAPGRLAVVDEFTSALDRDVARGAAMATRRALDRGVFAERKLVAVTCHDDVAEWLEPDWTLDMRDGRVVRGRLRRRTLEFSIRAASGALWRDFKEFHYLNGTLNAGAKRYVATLGDAVVAFAAILPCEGRRGRRRVHRLVVRPEYQGVGIGGAFLDALGRLDAQRGAILEIVVGVPFFARRLARSPLWRLKYVYPHGRIQRSHGRTIGSGSHGRGIVSFEFVSDRRKRRQKG